MLIRHRQFERPKMHRLHPDCRNRRGQCEFAATPIDQIAQQAVGPHDIGPHEIRFGARARHCPQMDQRVEVPPVQPAQILHPRKISNHHRHPRDLRRLARQADHLVVRRHIRGQRPADKTASSRNQYAHLNLPAGRSAPALSLRDAQSPCSAPKFPPH